MQSEIKTGADEGWQVMIPIKKGAAPEGLIQLQREAANEGLSPEEAYNKLKGSLRSQVRRSLVEEQGELCAYCMCRIPRTDAAPQIKPIIMEHIIPRNPIDGRDVGQGLDYENLVAVCHGNKAPRSEKRSSEDFTCDAHRGNIEFRKVNPCKPETLTTIFYTLDGKISATDADVKFDLVDTLNLNCPSAPLVAERKSVLDSLIAMINMTKDDELPEYCSNVLKAFQEETTQKTPYVGILIWYLQTMIDSFNGESA